MRGLKKSAVIGLCAIILPVGYVPAGDTNPPAGPVAGTMKTLDKVEPRIPICPDTTPGNATATYVISQPGSYSLTGPLVGENGKHGIRIGNFRVTIDLNGFDVGGQPGAFSG